MASSYFIRDVDVFTGEHALKHQSVIIADQLVQAVGPGLARPVGAELIDGTGRTLLPGLIDSHTHILGPALSHALRFGVTTELDMANSLQLLEPARRAQQDLSCNIADLRSAGSAATVPGGHGTNYLPGVPTLTRPDEAARFVADRLAEGSDYLKIHYEDGQITGQLAGHRVPVLPIETVAALATAARAQGALCLVHVGTAEAARQAIEAGVHGLAHIFFDRDPEPDFGEYAASKGVFIIPTLTTIELTAGGAQIAGLADDPALAPYLPEADRALLARHAAGTVPRLPVSLACASRAVGLAAAAGVPILAGTDAVLALHGSGLHRELELLVAAGLSPVQALAAATSVPARVFGLSDRGRVATGLRADLLLVDGDPTTDILASRQIVRIFKRGVPVDRHAAPPEWATFPPGVAEHAVAASGH